MKSQYEGQFSGMGSIELRPEIHVYHLNKDNNSLVSRILMETDVTEEVEESDLI